MDRGEQHADGFSVDDRGWTLGKAESSSVQSCPTKRYVRWPRMMKRQADSRGATLCIDKM